MKHYKYLFLKLMVCLMVVSGCDKYLDITPKGKTLLSTIEDYDQWLNNDALAFGVGQPTGILNYLGDNVDLLNIANPPILTGELIYTWAPQFSFDINSAPVFWGDHYAKINLFNTVLVGIDEATGGSNIKKRSLKAEALLGRALEYFYLVNEYAKPYDPATAGQDLAVPFVTSNDVTQEVPPRSTTAEIYQHIIDDLNKAIQDLPTDNSQNRFRGSVAAGYSILARVYFYQRNYAEAQKNAELALANTRAEMINFNGPFPSTNAVSIRPDVIYGRIVIASPTPTLEFMRSFEVNDLRPKTLYTSGERYTYQTRGATQFVPGNFQSSMYYVNTGTSVQEMKLIVAEGAARNDNLPLALQYLDEVREKRFTVNDYVRYESTDKEQVLQKILNERSHEFPFHGLRWFDMRRLDKEGRMGVVNRYNAQGAVIATLEPHSDRYTLQIPTPVMSFNPGMQQNP